jgi:hypothetical protein
MLEQIKAARDYLREEGQVIRQAPIAFTAGCFFVVGIVFAALEWHFNGQIDTQRDTIENQRSRIEQLQEELKGTSPQLAAIQANRDKVRVKLQKYYVLYTALWNRPVKSEQDIHGFTSDVNALNTESYDWIMNNMGEAAADKLFDPGSSPSLTFGMAYNADHNGALNLIAQARRNLSTLIETAAWDGKPHPEQ